MNSNRYEQVLLDTSDFPLDVVRIIEEYAAPSTRAVNMIQKASNKCFCDHLQEWTFNRLPKRILKKLKSNMTMFHLRNVASKYFVHREIKFLFHDILSTDIQRTFRFRGIKFICRHNSPSKRALKMLMEPKTNTGQDRLKDYLYDEYAQFCEDERMNPY
jgi:hypothetical protein